MSQGGGQDGGMPGAGFLQMAMNGMGGGSGGGAPAAAPSMFGGGSGGAATPPDVTRQQTKQLPGYSGPEGLLTLFGRMSPEELQAFPGAKKLSG